MYWFFLTRELRRPQQTLGNQVTTIFKAGGSHSLMKEVAEKCNRTQAKFIKQVTSLTLTH